MWVAVLGAVFGAMSAAGCATAAGDAATSTAVVRTATSEALRLCPFFLIGFILPHRDSVWGVFLADLMRENTPECVEFQRKTPCQPAKIKKGGCFFDTSNHC